MAEHVLKCWPEPFEAMVHGRKTHEFRKDDRGFQVGDILVLREWFRGSGPFPDGTVILAHFTGRELRRRVTYISRGPDWDIPEGYVVMSVAPVVEQFPRMPGPLELFLVAVAALLLGLWVGVYAQEVIP